MKDGIIIFLITTILAIVGADIAMNVAPTPKQEAECKKAHIVATSPDSINLYSVRPGGCDSTPVYFSARGTHTTHEECSGNPKARSCKTKNDDVTNPE